MDVLFRDSLHACGMLLLGLELANLILLSLFFSYHSSRKKMLGELVLTMSLKNEILVMMRCLVKWWAELNLSPEESLKRVRWVIGIHSCCLHFSINCWFIDAIIYCLSLKHLLLFSFPFLLERSYNFIN